MTANRPSRQIVLLPSIPDWVIEWLLEAGYAQEQTVESDKNNDPKNELHGYQPWEDEYVQGKKTGPHTDKPE